MQLVFWVIAMKTRKSSSSGRSLKAKATKSILGAKKSIGKVVSRMKLRTAHLSHKKSGRNQNGKRGVTLMAKSRRGLGKLTIQSKKIAKRIMDDPITKEYLDKQAELAKETVDKVEHRIKNKLNW